MPRKTTKKGGAGAPVRGYDNWTVGELRQKLSRRSADELEKLLRYEKQGRNRKSAIDAIERALSLSEEKGVAKARKVAPRGEELELGVFSRKAFLDRCSEFLEHEHGGVRLYELGLEKEEIAGERRERIEEFLEQTRRHVDILTAIITDLGGDPDELSPAAEVDREKVTALIESDIEGEAGLLNYFQNLAIAEFVDHANWELLAKLRGKIDDAEVASLLDEHIRTIEDEEDEHYRWAMKQVEQLSLADIFRGSEVAEVDVEVEEVEEREEGEGGSDSDSDEEAA